jgi:hypothetical protein
MDYSNFNLRNYGTFKGLDILKDIISLSSSATLLKPIPDESVLITLDPEHTYSNSQAFEQAIIRGTKPIDAMVYVFSRQSDQMKKVFRLVNADEADIDKRRIAAVKLTASMILIFVSRGSLPSAAGKSASQALPRFIKALIGDELGLNNESDLANALASFDMAHIDMSRFFENRFVGWDDTVINRMNLGVAGHKPLKVALALQPILDVKGDKRSSEIAALLLHKANKRGIYPPLHPIIQTIGNKYQEFYKSCIFALYQSMNVENKLQKLRQLSMLQMDTWVKSDSFPEYLPKYDSWDLNELDNDIGEPIILGTPEPMDKGKEKVEATSSQLPQVKIPGNKQPGKEWKHKS